MSKSLDNAILLSDEADAVQKKVMGMYTDPKRITVQRARRDRSGEESALGVSRDVQPGQGMGRRAPRATRPGKIGDVRDQDESWSMCLTR